MTTMTDSEAVINVLYDYDCQNSEEWNGDFRLPIEVPPERSQKLQRNFGVRHQEDKSHVLRRLLSSFYPLIRLLCGYLLGWKTFQDLLHIVQSVTLNK